MEPQNPHDGLVRAVFTSPEHAVGELRHVLPPELSSRLVALNPQRSPPLVDRLLAVVQKEDKEQIVSIADWFAEQGRQKGLAEGLRKALLRTLRARFGAVPEAAEARIQAAAGEQLEAWLDRVITASTVDEVIA